MSNEELAYAAGVFDGEGTVDIYPRVLYDTRKQPRRKLRHLCLAVKIANTDRRVIDWFKEKFTGTLVCRKYTNHYKDLWVWMLTGRKAAHFLWQVESYLIVKKEQATAGVLFGETMSWPLVNRHLRGGAFLSPEAEKLREMCYRFNMKRLIKGRRAPLYQSRQNGKAVVVA